MTRSADVATGQAWAALGGDPALLEAVSYGERLADGLPARLPVAGLARAAVAVCSLAAAELHARRSGGPLPRVHVDDGAVATAFTSERHLRIDGRAPTGFAPLSGFWRTADGWVRTHANYPHHRERLLDALGLPHDTGPDRLAAVLGTLSAHDVQERAYAAGGLAVEVRGAQERPAPGDEQLVRIGRTAAPGAGVRTFPPLPPGPALPAHGVRVLDLTRVTAGPVATRTLGLLGADVLRVDPPGMPEDGDTHTDTGFGKRSARLDLAVPADRAVLDGLLETADVLVTGYRPGALDRFGLSAQEAAARRPGLVVAQLCAWGWQGGWSGRRGFDSLVQAARGIAVAEAAPDGRPGALPAQALDHGTGYLLAAAVLRSLTEQSATGGGRLLRFGLTATAHWLMHGIPAEPVPADAAPAGPYDPAHRLVVTEAPAGRLLRALPPVRFDGSPADWSGPPSRWGTDRPVWR